MKLTQLGRGAAETGAGRDQFLPEGNSCELFGVRASFVVRQEPRAEEGLPSLALHLSGGLGVSGEEGRLPEARFCQAGPSAARAPPASLPVTRGLSHCSLSPCCVPGPRPSSHEPPPSPATSLGRDC